MIALKARCFIVMRTRQLRMRGRQCSQLLSGQDGAIGAVARLHAQLAQEARALAPVQRLPAVAIGAGRAAQASIDDLWRVKVLLACATRCESEAC